jgi:bacillithiol biosynthesis cysteine-adding enzyme BshC
LTSVLHAQQARRAAPEAARLAAAQLADSRSVAIVTGQQAGLFGGPLFTLLKALTAIALAKRVQSEHGVPAVPVFWVEGEDHDWDEVSSCPILDAEFHLRTVRLAPPPEANRAPVASIALDNSVTHTIDELAAALPATEFTAPLLDALRRAYAPGVGFAEAFARWLEWMTRDLGLVVFDCTDAAAKPLASKIFLHEARHPGHTWELAGDAGEKLAALGYHAQVSRSSSNDDSKKDDSKKGPALFKLNGARTPVDLANLSALEEAIRSQPAAFSPNVLLRPIVQDALFPTACYVTGPNELAYLGQLRGVYEHFGVPMPLLYPRASVTVLDSAAARFLSRHTLPLETLQPQDESALNRLLAASLPASVSGALDRATAALETSMADLIAAVPAVDPTLEGAARSTLGRVQHELTTLRAKVISAAKKRDETIRRQFARAQGQAFPNGTPQERAVGSISLLNRYGPAVVDRLLEELPLGLGQHWIVTI